MQKGSHCFSNLVIWDDLTFWDRSVQSKMPWSYSHYFTGISVVYLPQNGSLSLSLGLICSCWESTTCKCFLGAKVQRFGSLSHQVRAWSRVISGHFMWTTSDFTPSKWGCQADVRIKIQQAMGGVTCQPCDSTQSIESIHHINLLTQRGQPHATCTHSPAFLIKKNIHIYIYMYIDRYHFGGEIPA